MYSQEVPCGGRSRSERGLAQQASQEPGLRHIAGVDLPRGDRGRSHLSPCLPAPVQWDGCVAGADHHIEGPASVRSGAFFPKVVLGPGSECVDCERPHGIAPLAPHGQVQWDSTPPSCRWAPAGCTLSGHRGATAQPSAHQLSCNICSPVQGVVWDCQRHAVVGQASSFRQRCGC